MSQFCGGSCAGTHNRAKNRGLRERAPGGGQSGTTCAKLWNARPVLASICVDSRRRTGIRPVSIFREPAGFVALSSECLIRGLPSAHGLILLSPRSRWRKAAASQSAATESTYMLPGFRFLFAAVVLSVSIVIFGLGAAALLRASHEQFSNLPAWKAPPETVFAQQADAKPPTLAMLNVEPEPAQPITATPPGPQMPTATPEPAAAIPAPVVSPAAAPEIAKVVDPAPQQGESETPAVAAVAVQPAPDQPASDPAATVRETEHAVAAEPSAIAATAVPPAAQPEAKPEQLAVLPGTAEPTKVPAPVATPSVPAMQTETPAAVIAPETTPQTAPVTAAEAPVAAPTVEAAVETPPSAKPEQPAIASAAIPEPPKPVETVTAAPSTAPTAAATTDAPIRTAMLDQQMPEPAAALPPPVSIEGPIPLPRSRAMALARIHPQHPVVKQRKVATRTIRPRPVRRVAPAPAQAPAPSGLFPFQ